MAITILYFAALLPFAAFFGIAVFMEIAPIYNKLPARSFIEYFQKLDPCMRVWAKILMLGELGLVAALLAMHGAAILSAQGVLTLLAFLLAAAFLHFASRAA